MLLSSSPRSYVNERGPTMAVYLSGIEVRVSVSKACADWTVPAGFEGKVSFPPDLETRLPEVRRPGRCPCPCSECSRPACGVVNCAWRPGPRLTFRRDRGLALEPPASWVTSQRPSSPR